MLFLFLYYAIYVDIYIYANVCVNEVTGEDISEVFEKFCNTDYIDIINRECDAVIAEKKIPSPYPVEAFADDEEKSKRLVFLEQATAAQRSAAESEVEKAWLDYRSKQPMETAKYLSQNRHRSLQCRHISDS